MVDKIIEELRRMEQEIKDLRHEKAQAETFCAAIMKNVGELEFNFDDVFKSSYDNVRLIPNTENPSNVKVIYITE